jgi:hypothetical protein
MVRLDSSRINPTLFHATVSNILSQIYILADSDIYDFLLEISHSLIAENLSPTKEDLDMIKVFTNIFNLEVLENEIAC